MHHLPAAPASSLTAREAARWERGRLLGQGTAGVVHAGTDRLLGRPVAIKTLRQLSGHRLYWLKREFRCLAEFSHRNFAELYDLIVTDDDCFFTMELVEGTSFLERYRRPGPPAQVDYVGLRQALLQIAVALSALHAQHKLHRDIKPQNVVIDRRGRVVILDYDLVLDTPGESLRPPELAGTLMYMAPEQLLGRPPSPASDWYAVGAMTFEVLTGELPFAGERQQFAFDGSWHVPLARELAPETPADLDELVARLLSAQPEVRAGAEDVVKLLGPAGRDGSALDAANALTRTRALLGRDHELELLQDAFADGGARTVTIEGSAGIGKTALVEHFLRGLEREPDVLVLRGRSHPREVVPLNAVDAAIDDLHRYILHQPEEARARLLSAADPALVRLFPVFADLYPTAERESTASPELRERAFAAVRSLVAAVAGDVRIVLWLDDFHWSDLDSVALLRALRREPDPPSILTILSFRGDEPGSSEILAAARDARWGLDTEQQSTTLALGPVAEQPAREIAAAVLSETAAEDQTIAAVVAAAAGSPLLLVELSRHASEQASGIPGTARLEEIVAERLRRLPAETREILRLLAVSSVPTPEEIVFQFGDSRTVLQAVALLRSELLVRRVTREQVPAVDVYHSRVRDAVLACTEADELRRLHRRWIELLEQAEVSDPTLLVEHHFGAGDTAAAAELALSAARYLTDALAPNAAAAMYRRAIDLGAHGYPLWELQARLGASLIDAGHGGEGARWLDRAATTLLDSDPTSLEASRLRRRAAEHYLRSGMHGEGLGMLRQVLAARRLYYPGSVAAALGSMLLNRTRVALVERRGETTVRRDVSAEDREILETLWSAGVGLSLFDGIRAADFNARHALWGRQLQDVGHMARASASEGLILAWEGGRRKHERSQQRLARGKDLAHRSGDPNVIAHAMLMEAASAYMEARWRDAILLAADVEEMCTHRCQGAAWELANAHVMTSNSLACLGEARRLREHLPRILRKASERDDQYLLVTGRLGHANCVWLMSDRADEARRQAQDALAGPFPPGYAWQVYQGALAIGQIELYVDEPEAGWEHTKNATALMQAQHMMRFLPTRVEMLDLRARCGLALVRQISGPRRRKLLRFVEQAARAIGKEDAVWVKPFALALRAGLAVHEGQSEAAGRLYLAAAEAFDPLGMRMHAWSMRHRASELGAPVSSIDAGWPAEQGIRDAGRLARVFAP